MATVLRHRIKKNAKKADDVIMNTCVAPAEHGNFQNWREDIYLEEKCFPHLFPYGIGGYLSSHLSTGIHIRFAAYCRHRVLNADAKFRNDHVYLAFLLLVKEHIELKRSICTYFRQARKTPGLSLEYLSNIRYQSLERYGRVFTAFKNVRGTAMYFQAVKNNLMATIRQKGCPTHFITISAGEWNWRGLLKSIYETVTKKKATDELINNLTTTEKNIRERCTDNNTLPKTFG